MSRPSQGLRLDDHGIARHLLVLPRIAELISGGVGVMVVRRPTPSALGMSNAVPVCRRPFATCWAGK